jgi:pyruvate/2-oxoglutarate dehydrogenase complex dihydrolipoamide acyltransferase (E2) component
MSFFAKASVPALKDIPAVNAQIAGPRRRSGDRLLRLRGHLGVAVSAPNGLVVPVVRDVDKMQLCQHREGDCRLRQEGARRHADDGRHGGRHLHDFERRRVSAG